MELEAMKELVEELKANDPKYKFFNQCFPEIEDEKIPDYVVVFPTKYEAQLNEADAIHNWMYFTEYADDIMAYDNSTTPFTSLDLKAELGHGG